jgi:hypothetical protein
LPMTLLEESSGLFSDWGGIVGLSFSMLSEDWRRGDPKFDKIEGSFRASIAVSWAEARGEREWHIDLLFYFSDLDLELVKGELTSFGDKGIWTVEDGVYMQCC